MTRRDDYFLLSTVKPTRSVDSFVPLQPEQNDQAFDGNDNQLIAHYMHWHFVEKTNTFAKTIDR